MKAPNSRGNLDIAIRRRYGLGDEYMRARTVMANAIVGQMLPGGAVKGGSAIKLRRSSVGGLDVLQSAEDAVVWANELIAQIASA